MGIATRSTMQDLLLSILALVTTLLVVLVLVFLGWYLVWKFFLLRFKFIQELFLSTPQSSGSVDSGRQRKRTVRKD
jgi:cytoskeletal protein RodZ